MDNARVKNAVPADIAEILGVQPWPPHGSGGSRAIEKKDDKALIIDDNMEKDNDLEYIRRNLYDMVESTRQSIDVVSQLAETLQSARMFEVLAQLVKAYLEANEKLLLLKKTKKELLSHDDIKSAKTVHNNLFVTTNELAEMIEKAKNGNTVDN